MNNLSWLLYAADVSSSIKGLTPLAWTMFVLSIPAIGLGIVVHSCARSRDGYGTSGLDKEAHIVLWEEKRKLFWVTGWRLMVASFAISLVLAAIPSRNTIYAIAISEGGERIVNSEAVQGVASDAMKALNAWIKKQIE